LGSGISLMTREEGMLSRTAARIFKVEKTRENVIVVVALIKRGPWSAISRIGRTH
jgi:hypothetical protein